MTRRPLPSLQSVTGESPLFPSFQREMNRLFDQFRAGFPVPETSGDTGFAASVFPAIDIVETDSAIEISAEVPGVSEENLEATIAGDTLVLKGEKSSDHDETEDSYHRIERHYGRFRRQIPLGFAPEDNAVDAKFTAGVLKIRISKPEAAAAGAGVRKIDISNR
ncbi:Hsp20/alpha crystallin family protein [Roseobacter weihaiensis]|uniref:Hsp20/alpha crystallin family protein n=1 Tax=Roseobacter weihaiensis TaxID=2763262 RepID=UPI001D0B7A14|nr:Hsp20/alpha crystallin family protein [Roseobacter sp. H9]